MEKFWLRKKTTNELRYYLNIIFIVGLFAVLVSIVYLGANPYIGEYREGDIALTDIYAPYDFTYKGDIDEDKMREAAQIATSKVPPVFELDGALNFSIKNEIAKFFDRVNELKKNAEIDEKEKLNLLKSEFLKKPADESLRILLSTEKSEDFEKNSEEILNKILNSGYLSDGDRDAISKSKITSIDLFDAKSDSKKEVALDGFFTSDTLDKKIQDGLALLQNFDKKEKDALADLVKSYLEPNLRANPSETNKIKEGIIKNIPPVYKEILVKKNEIILEKGQRVSKLHLTQLTNITKKDTISAFFSYLGGVGLLLAIFMTIMFIYFMIYEKKISSDVGNLYLIASIILIMVSMAKIVIISPLSSYFIPVASGSMILAILLNYNVAFIVNIILAIFTGIIAGGKFGITITAMVGGWVGIYSVLKLRRRSQILKAGFLVGIANFFTIVGIGFLNNLKPGSFMIEGIWGFASGITSALVVTGFLPLFEYIFKIPTNITLLELSDLNHPLLRQLVLKAPGTYHHSIIVGNLAEEACEAIGANSLLARVGAYYHDIGKIEKAEYFSENQPDTITSEHEELKPSMSSLIITSHVKDGVDLAKKYNLNHKIIEFIQEHHGTGLVYYFYKKALEKGDLDSKVKDEDFRYPGPKPQSKEAAIVLLADSVEAASRSIINPTPTKIKEQLQRIINNKFIDGQLDDCELTLRDLHKIADSFVRLLTGMFHTRVQYSEGKETEEGPDFEA